MSAEKIVSLVEAGVRQELGKPRYFQLAFERGDAHVVIPRTMQPYEAETLREWFELILKSVERAAALRPNDHA